LKISHRLDTVLLYQHRCEVWCPSGSDDDCPDGQLCFAFSQCHAVDMNATTLEQQKEAQAAASQNGGGSAGASNVTQGGVASSMGTTVGIPAPPTKGPTNKPSLSAEEAMHRHSFCGKFWDDVSGVLSLKIFVSSIVSHQNISSLLEGKRQL
jgi:hypothetical protein